MCLMCLTLCDPMGCSPPGSSVHGILQARILEFPPPGDGPNPGIEPTSVMFPALAGGFFTTRATLEDHTCVCVCVCVYTLDAPPRWF